MEEHERDHWDEAACADLLARAEEAGLSSARVLSMCAHYGYVVLCVLEVFLVVVVEGDDEEEEGKEDRGPGTMHGSPATPGAPTAPPPAPGKPAEPPAPTRPGRDSPAARRAAAAGRRK